MSGYMSPLTPPLSDSGSDFPEFVCHLCCKKCEDRAAFRRHYNQHGTYVCRCSSGVSGRMDVLRRHWATKGCTYRGQNVEDCLWFPAGTPQEKIKEAQSLIRQFPQAASAQLQQQCFARGITPPWSDDGNEQSQPPLFVNLPAMPFSGNGEYLQVNHAGRSYSIPDEMPRVNVFKQGSLYGPQLYEEQKPVTVAPHRITSSPP